MTDKTLASLITKVQRLGENYEKMSEKIDLLIHSVNNLYDEVYRDVDCCNCKSASEEEDVEDEPVAAEDVEDEPVATEDKETGNEIESVADVILAIAEELERRKKL